MAQTLNDFVDTLRAMLVEDIDQTYQSTFNELEDLTPFELGMKKGYVEGLEEALTIIRNQL